MSIENEYQEKWNNFNFPSYFEGLSLDTQNWIKKSAFFWRFSVQELRQFIEICRDYQMWDQEEHWLKILSDSALNLKGNPPQQKKQLLLLIHQNWNTQKLKPIQFTESSSSQKTCGSAVPKVILEQQQAPAQVLGMCPVASPQTLCCELQTLDVVQNCAFACNYCSIQTFHKPQTITFYENLAQRLSEIVIDPDKIYHIGTGQSSDSLMWGNKLGLFDDLTAWLMKHPKVILELKSKSQKVNYFLENPIPQNLVMTWSVNPDVVIDHEELGTAGIKDRLQAARKVADKGIKVGFHFHPIFYYENFEADYAKLALSIKEMFAPQEVVLLSYGTLTFTQKTLQNIRQKSSLSHVLHMPFSEASGKYSYPVDVKVKMFKHVSSFFEEWKGQVFQYLCMEKTELWQKTWGYEYPNNSEFSKAMKEFYYAKVYGKN